MEALEPAAGGGAKLTKDQILAGFGTGDKLPCSRNILLFISRLHNYCIVIKPSILGCCQSLFFICLPV